MRRFWSICCLLLAGCSTHPCADFLDHFFPGRVRADPATPPRGGVCIPQGAPLCPGAAVGPGAPGIPVPLGAPVFPGGVPPTPTPLGPEGGIIPPPPPPPPR